VALALQVGEHAIANHMVQLWLHTGIQIQRIFMAVENIHSRATIILETEGSARHGRETRDSSGPPGPLAAAGHGKLHFMRISNTRGIQSLCGRGVRPRTTTGGRDLFFVFDGAFHFVKPIS
jgi:hypothetical protein